MKSLPKIRPNPRKEEEEASLREEVLATGLNPLCLWRKRHNLSRVELAAICGVNTGTIEKLELGYYKTISQRLLSILHDKAGIPYELAAAYIIWRNMLADRAAEKVKDRD